MKLYKGDYSKLNESDLIDEMQSIDILKLSDLVTFHNALFHNNLLPCYFDTFLTLLENIHSYHTRSAANQ